METIAIAIIIGIISTIFNKKKGMDKGILKEKPFFNRGHLQDIYTTLKENTGPNTPSFAQPEPHSTKQAEWESTDKTIKMKETPSRNKTNQIKVPSKAEMSNNENFLIEKTDTKELVNAVIWSEILGEPRSKKPHFARKR